jgi:hypothetical protein
VSRWIYLHDLQAEAVVDNYIYTTQAAECDARDPARPGSAAATLYPPMLPAGWIL